MKKSIVITLLCLFILTSCQGMQYRLQPYIEGAGVVVLYLQPFPQEADRIRFTLEGISALGSDGREIPFHLKLSQIKGRELTSQRLLAEAQLPPGFYTGLSMKVKDAHLRGEEGEAALMVPETPVRFDFSFAVSRKKGHQISLAFKPAESVIDGFAFRPLFSLYIPSVPIALLAGYVSNYGSNTITVFDKKSGQAAGVIATSGQPAGMAMNQRAGRVYVALPDLDEIEVIDITAGEITDRIRLNPGDRPRELALTPDGRTLFAVNTGSNTVSAIDLVPLFEAARIAVGNGPTSILIDRLGRRGYVCNNLSSTISVIDITNKSLIATIATESGPLRGQFNRSGDRLFVIHEWSPYINVVHMTTLSVEKRFSVGLGIKSIKVDASTGLVYLGRGRDAAVGIYEPSSFVSVDFLPTGSAIGYLTIDGFENNMLMVSPESQRLLIVNLISKRTLSIIDVGDSPYAVIVTGER